MVHQPVQVEQSLVDDVFIHGPFVLNDHRATVFVDTKGVKAAAVGFAGRVFRGQEADTKEGFQVLFNEGLEGFFYLGGMAFNFGDDIAGEAEDFYVAHEFLNLLALCK